jgi:hypothetical protein
MATVDPGWTWAQRGGIALAAALLAWRLRARRTEHARVTAQSVVARRA